MIIKKVAGDVAWCTRPGRNKREDFSKQRTDSQGCPLVHMDILDHIVPALPPQTPFEIRPHCCIHQAGLVYNWPDLGFLSSPPVSRGLQACERPMLLCLARCGL